MPYYQWYSKKTGKDLGKPEFMKISEFEVKLASDPDLDTRPAGPPQGDGFQLGTWKPDNHSHFRETMAKIKQHHPKNSIDGSW